MTSSVVEFYAGQQPDHRGRFLRDLQSWDAGRLEAVHDYIQWLFPLPEPSPVNPLAPVLDDAAIRAFHLGPELRAALLHSLRMMIAFYGFSLTESDPPAAHAARDLAQTHWLQPGNHNMLRITRILRCTQLLGLESYSKAFFTALDAVYRTDAGSRAIGRVSWEYWRAAASQPGMNS